MEPAKTLNPQAKIYPVKQIKYRPFVLMLILILAIFGLAFFRVQYLSQHHLEIGSSFKRFENQMVFFLFFSFFNIYIISKANDRLPRRFELTQEGITKVDRFENKSFMAWDEIGKVTRTGARALRLEGTKLNRKFIIPGLTEGFEEISKRIMEEYRRRQAKPEPDGQALPVTAFGKRKYWFVSGFFTFFVAIGIAAMVGSAHSENSLYQTRPGLMMGILVLDLLVFIPPAIYFTLKTRDLYRYKFVVNDDGLLRLDQDENRVFIGWDKIGKVNEITGMANIAVQDHSGKIKIWLSDAYEGFYDLKERICEQYTRDLKEALFPLAVGKQRFYRPIFGLVFFSIITGFLDWGVLFKTDRNDPSNFHAGLFAALLFSGFFVYANIFSFRRIEKAILNTNGLILCRFIGKVFIPWGQLAQVEWFLPKGSLSSDTYALLQITDGRGKSYNLDGELDFRLRLYAYLNRQLRTNPAVGQEIITFEEN